MTKTFVKPLALCLVVILVLVLLPGVTAFSATADPDGFTRITTAQELDTMVRKGLTGKYRLYADIDLSGYAYNSSSWTAKAGWAGIGTFKGTFDGNGHTIKGLWSKDRGSNQGLFTHLSGATITNLTIELASPGITGAGERKGALSGNAYDGTVIDNVHVYGAGTNGSSIAGSANYIAGLVGVVYKSTVKNASVHYIQLSGYSYVAGLAGVIYYQSDVAESYVEKVNAYAAGSYAGGFAGAVYDKSPVVNYCAVFDSVVTAKGPVAGGFTAIAYDTASLSRCYVDGIAVKAHSYAGGFAGQIHGSAAVSISCAQNGTAETTATYIAGGFVGEFAYWGNVSNCYAQINVTSKTSGAGSFVGYYSDAGDKKYINNTYGAGTVKAGLSLHHGAYAGFTSSVYGKYSGTNYYDSSLTAGLSASGTSSNGVGTGLPKGYDTATMKKQATFVGWDFTNIWRIDETITYPYFLWTGNMFGVTPEISKTSRNITSTDAETRVNDILEFTITVKNNGVASWNAVNVIDALPAGVTYVEGSVKIDGAAASASYVDSSRTLTVPLGNLAPGAQKTVLFQAKINADAYGMTIQNSVTVKGVNSRTGTNVEQSVTDDGSYNVATASLTRKVTGSVYPLVSADLGLGAGFLSAFDVIVELRPTFSTPAAPGLSVKAVAASGSDMGSFTFENVPFGTYVLTITRPGYLVRCMMVTIAETDPDTVSISPPDGPAFELWAGDVDGSMQIDGSDNMIIMARIGVSYGQPQYIAGADLNGDGLINTADRDLAMAMLNKSSFDYPGADDVNWD